MTNPSYYLEATEAILDNLQAFDLWFPKVGAEAAAAWADHFAKSGLSAEDLLDGVNHAREQHTKTAVARAESRSEAVEQFRPTPDLIVRHAHAARRAVLAALPQSRIDDMELANHVLQDMGLTPRRAHQLSRDIALAVALGRPPRTDLTAEQMDEFKTRFNKSKTAITGYIDRRRELANTLRVADLFAIGPTPENVA